MADTCPRCRRPLGDDHRYSSDPDLAFAQCRGDGDVWCMGASAGFRQGIERGVELAKARVTASVQPQVDGYYVRFHWTTVHDAVKQELQDADA